MSDAQPIRRKGITLGAPRRMSADEMSAVESRIIEENFPKHRTLHLKPIDDAPQLGDYSEIVVTEEVLLATAHHVAQDLTKESGGFLLGNRYECPNTNRNYIIVDQFMKADYTEGTQVSLTFTTDSWAQLTNRLDGKYRGKQLVGWYHSHPGMGIFLSNYDVDIHKNRFSNPWDVALVLDPVKHEGGFFAWVDGNVNPREKLDFHELLEGDSRDTVVAWTNYTAEDPKTGMPAALKATNTQTSDGVPAAAVSPNGAKAYVAPTTGGLFSNPYLIIGGAAVLMLFLLGAAIAAYLYFGRSDTGGNGSETEEVVNNKVLNGDRIIIGKDIKGYMSGENKLIVDFQINNIGETEVIESVRNDKSLNVKINSQQAAITKSTVDNGAILNVRAEIPMSDDAINAFASDKAQDFLMLIDISYNGDYVSREFKTKFQKGNGTNSLGDLVAFSNNINQGNVTPKVKPKVVVPDKPNAPQQNNDTPKQSQTTVTKPIDKPKGKDKPRNNDTSTQGGVIIDDDPNRRDKSRKTPTPTPKPKGTKTPVKPIDNGD